MVGGLTTSPRSRWTRYSLFYLATYFSITGVGFLLAPGQTLDLLLATGTV